MSRFPVHNGGRYAVALFLGAGVIALGLVCGCGDEAQGPDPDPGGSDDTLIPIDVTSSEALLASYAQAIEAKDMSVYSALLAQPGVYGQTDPGFQFYIRADQADQFPWIPAQWWGATDELDMMGHMFDPTFTGESPPVQTLRFGYTILAERKVTDPVGIPATEMTVDVIVTVLTGPNDGYTSDTRMIFTVGNDAGAHLRIRKIQEVLKLEPGRVESSSWGQIKGLYR